MSEHSHLDSSSLAQLQEALRRAQRAHPETAAEYAARHQAEAAETKPDRLDALAADVQGMQTREPHTDYLDIDEVLIFGND